jgi:hypothetical protein
VSSLTGLTQGRFPVAARATYAEQLTRRELAAREGTTPARLDESDGHRKAIRLYARDGAPVVAVTDGRIVGMGRSGALGRFISLQDAYGNTYTYADLGTVAARYPVPKRHRTTQADVRRELALPENAPAPTHAASRTTRSELEARLVREPPQRAARRRRARPPAEARPREDGHDGHRLHARRGHRRRDRERRAARQGCAGEAAPVRASRPSARGRHAVVTSKKAGLGKLDASLEGTRKLRLGSRVTAGTVLGSVGRPAPGAAANVRFEIRPAGRGAPRIDPKPILDGWKLLESTAVYRAKGTNPFFGPDAATPSVGQILLMGKDTLAERVLTDPHIEIYACGREDIRAGLVDQRVLATLEYLAASGLRPTVSSLECGHSYLTASGNVSEHSSGNAVDIAAINGVPIAGNQGAGSITDITIQRLLSLQGAMKPHQIISLMTFPGTDNTYSMPDHADHIHIGWEPQFGANTAASRQVHAIVKPSQWVKLISRLGQIANPQVRKAPSRYALSTTRRGSAAHKGE